MAGNKIDFEPEEQEPMEAQAQAPAPDDEVIKKAMGLSSPTFKSLDYLGGIGRTLAGMGMNINPQKSSMDDLLLALKGKAPSGSDILKKGGVPAGPSANLFPEVKIPYTDITLGKGDTSLRDAAGLALEVGTDPFSFATGESKAFRPVSDVLESAGKKTYKSGLKRIDQEVAKYGKDPVSDVLMKNKVWGSAKSIQNQMDDLGEKLLAERDAILKDATDKGGRASMADAMAPVEKRIQEIRASRDPELQQLADALESKVKEYKDLDARPADITGSGAQESPTPQQASGYKTSIGASLPDNVWRNDKVRSSAKSADTVSYGGMKKATEDSVARVLGQDAAASLASKNDELGRILTSKEKAAMEANKEGNKNLITSVDAPLAVYDPKMAAFKKLADIAKLTSVRTGAGLGMMNLAQGARTSPIIEMLSKNLASAPQSEMSPAQQAALDFKPKKIDFEPIED